MDKPKPKIFFSGKHDPEFLKSLTSALGEDRFHYAYNAVFPPEEGFDVNWQHWFDEAIKDTSLFIGLYDASFNRRFWREYEEAIGRKLPILAVIFPGKKIKTELQTLIVQLRLSRDEAHKVIFINEENVIERTAREVHGFFDSGRRFDMRGEVESNVFVAAEGAESGVTGVTREYLESDGGEVERAQTKRAAEESDGRSGDGEASESTADEAWQNGDTARPGAPPEGREPSLLELGQSALMRGEYDEARSLYARNLNLSEKRGDQRGVAITLYQLGNLAESEGAYEEARRYYGQSFEVSGSVGEQVGVKAANRALERLARRQQGSPEGAKRDEAPTATAGEARPAEKVAAPGADVPRTDAVEADAYVGASPQLNKVMNLAEQFRQRLGRQYIESAMVATSLFVHKETGPAYSFLSTFGVRRDELIKHLWRHYRRELPPDFDLNELIAAADEFEGNNEYARKLQEAYNDAVSRGDAERTRHGTLPRHLFATLLDDPAKRTLDLYPWPVHDNWIESIVGTERLEWIRKFLEEWPADQPITQADVQRRAVKDKLFVPTSAQADSAAVKDLLGFERHAEALVEIIRKPETRPPLVVGVYGPWGSGKSTFMGFVRRRLEEGNRAEQPAGRVRSFFRHVGRQLAGFVPARFRAKQKPGLKVVTIEYDAWAYADAPKLWSGLIGKVARELDAELGWRGRLAFLFKRHGRRLAAAALLGLLPVILFVTGWLGGRLQEWAAGNDLAARSLAFLKPFGAALETSAGWLWEKGVAGALSVAGIVSTYLLQRRPVTDAVTALASRFDTKPGAAVVSRIQDEFKTALQTRISPDGAETDETRKSNIRRRIEQNELKIVVFIDELDRCPLERIVDILEAIKLFLAEDLFIVFLGVDTRVASEAIRLHYKEVKNPDLPREYLEKIVQLPLRVPTAPRERIGDFLRHFMTLPEGTKATNGDAPPATTATREPSPQQPTAPESENGRGQSRAAAPVGGGATTSTGTADSPQPNSLDEHRSPFPVGMTSRSMLTAALVRPSGGQRAAAQTDSRLAPSALSSLPALPDTEVEFNFMAEIAEKFLESNPRRIKRLLNTYRYVKILSSMAGQAVEAEEWQRDTLAWLAFTMRWPAFMERAIEQAAAPGVERQAAKFLSTLTGRTIRGEEEPSDEQIGRYLPFSAEQVRLYGELAGNFLIENPRPHAPAEEAKEVKEVEEAKGAEQPATAAPSSPRAAV